MLKKVSVHHSLLVIAWVVTKQQNLWDTFELQWKKSCKKKKIDFSWLFCFDHKFTIFDWLKRPKTFTVMNLEVSPSLKQVPYRYRIVDFWLCWLIIYASILLTRNTKNHLLKRSKYPVVKYSNNNLSAFHDVVYTVIVWKNQFC